ncbi:MAG TPA: SPW repeat protein [Acetobacteraceae bacterium]|nr:SPW repeat protein [Acetobacteraceae bacterium]
MATFADRRVDHVQDWINLALAVLLFISPWVFGFSGEPVAAWNAWVCSVIVGVFSIAALVNFAEWEEWVNLGVGAWLVISPWVLQFAAVSPALWTELVLGALILVVAAWEIWSTRHPMPRATA